jgi:hypothetical protein
LHHCLNRAEAFAKPELPARRVPREVPTIEIKGESRRSPRFSVRGHRRKLYWNVLTFLVWALDFPAPYWGEVRVLKQIRRASRTKFQAGKKPVRTGHDLKLLLVKYQYIL